MLHSHHLPSTSHTMVALPELISPLGETGSEGLLFPLVPVPSLPSKHHKGGGQPTLYPADHANTSACVVPKGSRWKYVPLLGEDLDLRRITWRLPAETIPRLSGSSCFSSDTEGLLHEEDSDVATGSLRRSGTPCPQAGEGQLH